MKLKAGIIVVIAAFLLGGTGAFAQQGEKDQSSQPAKVPTKPQLVTEGEFAKWLVQVLGLSRFVSAAPTEQECFASLLQNGISPKEGWNPTNVVTRATLARVVVQAMGLQAEIDDPDNDAAWIEYLKSIGIDISTIGAAVENLEVLDSPLANLAVVVSTDPLAKVAKTRPTDEQQMGADLSSIRRILIEAQERPPVPTPTPTPQPRPPSPPAPPSDMTPVDRILDAVQDTIRDVLDR